MCACPGRISYEKRHVCFRDKEDKSIEDVSIENGGGYVMGGDASQIMPLHIEEARWTTPLPPLPSGSSNPFWLASAAPPPPSLRCVRGAAWCSWLRCCSCCCLTFCFHDLMLPGRLHRPDLRELSGAAASERCARAHKTMHR